MSRQDDDEGDDTETPGDQTSSESNYKVGYGRPPKTHSFKKGKSGNPSGRPKREQMNLKAAVNASLTEPITVRAKGKEKHVTG